jgi:acyl carrier protein phosphodiesterase
MASRAENSFGARLARAQQLLGKITNFQNWNPPRYEESVAGFAEFINTLLALNQEETGLEQQYNTMVKTRENFFYKDPNCITKLLAMIRGAVEAQYGQGSIEFKQIDTLVRQMRDSAPAVRAATANRPEGTVSQSERSYGSLTKYFSDLVVILSQLSGYATSNPILAVASLQNLVAQANQMAVEIPTRHQLLTACRDRRRDMYKEMKTRGSRMKAYSKSNYGLDASEYKQIKGISL